MKKKLFACLAIGILTVGFGRAVSATPLSLGWTVLSGENSTDNISLQGASPTGFVVPFTMVTGVGAGTISGNVSVSVTKSYLDNTYDFYWKVSNDATSTGNIGALRTSLETFDTTYEAGYRTDSLGEVDPVYTYLGISSRGGYFLNYYFDLAPGQSTKSFFLNTTATSFTPLWKAADIATLGESGFSNSFTTFSPTAPVPEPATMLLMGTGLAGLIGARRKKKA